MDRLYSTSFMLVLSALVYYISQAPYVPSLIDRIFDVSPMSAVLLALMALQFMYFQKQQNILQKQVREQQKSYLELIKDNTKSFYKMSGSINDLTTANKELLAEIRALKEKIISK